MKLAGDPNLQETVFRVQETVFRVPASAGKGLIIKPFPAEAGTLNTVLQRHELLPGQPAQVVKSIVRPDAIKDRRLAERIFGIGMFQRESLQFPGLRGQHNHFVVEALVRHIELVLIT